MKLESVMGCRMPVLVGKSKENIVYPEVFGNELKDFKVGSDNETLRTSLEAEGLLYYLY